MKIIRFSSLLVLLTLVFAACEDDKDLQLGERSGYLAGINDTWKLVSVKQIDELNKSSNNFRDVSKVVVGSTPATATFNASDFSFSIDKGTSKFYFPLAGKWSFDDNEFPTKITFENGGQSYVVNLGGPVRENVDNKLVLKYTRPIGACVADIGGKAGAVTYEYVFERQ
jgi:hypothetical protein